MGMVAVASCGSGTGTGRRRQRIFVNEVRARLVITLTLVLCALVLPARFARKRDSVSYPWNLGPKKLHVWVVIAEE